MSPNPASIFFVRNDTNFAKEKKEYEETYLWYEKSIEDVRFSGSLGVVFEGHIKVTSDFLN